MPIDDTPPLQQAHSTSRSHNALLWGLLFAFVLRVLGQATQHWIPQTFLPPFSAFQGSRLPYGLLLTLQLAIVSAMAVVCERVRRGELVPSRRARNILASLGGIYMACALARIAVGLELPEAPAWFTAWIPAGFHVVLAGFVLTLAAYHHRQLHRQMTVEAGQP